MCYTEEMLKFKMVKEDLLLRVEHLNNVTRQMLFMLKFAVVSFGVETTYKVTGSVALSLRHLEPLSKNHLIEEVSLEIEVRFHDYDK